MQGEISAVHGAHAEKPDRGGKTLNQQTSYSEPPPERPTGQAFYRGWRGKCPDCGKGPLFSKYLKVRNQCDQCGLKLHNHRADDAPPYFTIFITAHVMVPALVMLERAAQPPLWLQITLGLTLTATLGLLLLPRVKGATIGLQWAKHMHGFGEGAE